jgi:hypothetical protein
MRLSYEAKKMAIAASLIVYCTVGIASKSYFILAHRPPTTELYPFFSWYLFADIPQTHTEYRIEVLSLGERTYEPPLPFSDTAFLFARIGRAPTEYTPIIQALGTAITAGDEPRVGELRGQLETMFSGTPARYSVVRVVYDPLIYWKSGAYITHETMGTFDAGL